MTESAPTPEAGALSVDQAIAQLDALPPEQEQEAAPAEAAAEEPETEAETSPAEEPSDEPETLEAGEEAEPSEEPVVAAEAPRYWSQEAKAKFAELPPELQAVVLEQEGPREEAAAKAKQEALEVRQRAEKELQGVSQLAELLVAKVPQWQQAFADKWGSDPDWVAYANEYGADQATLAKFQYDAERQQLQEAQRAQQIAQSKAQQAYLEAEFAQLAEIAPDLAPDPKDPAKGSEKRAEVSNYLLKEGIPQEQIVGISARELSIARKAMLWDQAQASLKASPKQPVQPVKQAVKPAAAATHVSPKAREASVAKNRFVQTRSIDDAIALLNSQG